MMTPAPSDKSFWLEGPHTTVLVDLQTGHPERKVQVGSFGVAWGDSLGSEHFWIYSDSFFQPGPQ